MDELKWMGLGEKGCCTPWAPLIANAPQQKACFQVILAPKYLFVLS